MKIAYLKKTRYFKAFKNVLHRQDILVIEDCKRFGTLPLQA